MIVDTIIMNQSSSLHVPSKSQQEEACIKGDIRMRVLFNEFALQFYSKQYVTLYLREQINVDRSQNEYGKPGTVQKIFESAV
jgi:hypothetical protein